MESEKIPEDQLREVVYIRDNAFTKCDCGKDMGLHDFSGNKTYTGKCLCGKEYILKDKKILGLFDN